MGRPGHACRHKDSHQKRPDSFSRESGSKRKVSEYRDPNILMDHQCNVRKKAEQL